MLLLLVVHIYMFAQIQIARFHRYIKMIRTHCDNDEKEHLNRHGEEQKKSDVNAEARAAQAMAAAGVVTVNEKLPKLASMNLEDSRVSAMGAIDGRRVISNSTIEVYHTNSLVQAVLRPFWFGRYTLCTDPKLTNALKLCTDV